MAIFFKSDSDKKMKILKTEIFFFTLYSFYQKNFKRGKHVELSFGLGLLLIFGTVFFGTRNDPTRPKIQLWFYFWLCDHNKTYCQLFYNSSRVKKNKKYFKPIRTMTKKMVMVRPKSRSDH